jgi:hypothetical protein
MTCEGLRKPFSGVGATQLPSTLHGAFAHALHCLFSWRFSREVPGKFYAG